MKLRKKKMKENLRELHTTELTPEETENLNRPATSKRLNLYSKHSPQIKTQA